MPLFKRKPRRPLDEVFRHIGEAVEILHAYKRSKTYMPSEGDLALFDEAQDEIWQAHATAEYIARCMHQRCCGEPEGANKFTDMDVFDYRYPP